jgi:hypothetical protein
MQGLHMIEIKSRFIIIQRYGNLSPGTSNDGLERVSNELNRPPEKNGICYKWPQTMGFSNEGYILSCSRSPGLQPYCWQWIGRNN